MLGGYAAFTLIGWGAGYWSALVLVPILVGLVGWGLEEFGIRPLLPRADRAIVTLLLTFGVSLILRDIAQVMWGTETHAIAAPLTGIVNVADVVIPTYRLFVFGCGLVAILATWWLVYRTRIGAVLRATAVDPSMVASFGIPIRLVYGFTFLYGCGLAGLAGVLLSPIYAVFPTMGHDFLVMAFAVVIVGGMGSIIGAVVAALLLAQVQGLASLWIPPVWAETAGLRRHAAGARGAAGRVCSTGSERRDAGRRRMPSCGIARVARRSTTVADRFLRALRPTDRAPRCCAASAGRCSRWPSFSRGSAAPSTRASRSRRCCSACVALSVDILLGYAGLLSLGQAAYFGLAAYISALMYVHVTQSFWLVR